MRAVTGATGVCAVLGGAALAAACFAQNTAPQGCIGDTCDTRPMRDSPAAAVVLEAFAAGLIALSLLGLLVLAHERGRLGRVGRAGAFVGGLGLALLVAAGVVAISDPDFEQMPGLVVPGVLLALVGLLLLAWAIYRADLLPRWLTVLVLVCVLVMVPVNEQTSRVLLAVPFGVAWMLVGLVVLRSPQVSAARAPS